MATLDNERYLRYIFLLGKGGPLVLKGIINREVQNEGKTLSQILLDNNGRLRQLIRNDSQYERVFPSAGPVNSDLDTWDISLLCLVLLNIFGSKLSSQERNDIKNIRTFRNEVQGHFASLSLEEGEYNNYRSDLIVVLLNLSNGLNRQIYDSCQDLIKTAASGSLEIRSTLEDFKEFQEELLTQIEINFDATYIKLDAIIKQIQERGQTTYQQLSDIKTKQDDTNQISHEIKDMLVQLIEIHKVKNQSSRTSSDIKEDIETRLSVRSDTAEHASNAEDTLVQRINEILNEVNRQYGISRALKVEEHVVRRRVQRLLLRNQTCSDQQELTYSVLELILDIIRQPGTSMLSAKKSCIRLQYRCTTYEGMLGLLEYMESENYQKRLKDISLALTAQTGFACSLTSRISTEHLQESLYNLAARRKDNENLLQCERSVVLPVRCTDVLGLEHIWNQFQERKADHHMERISNALSRIVGGKTVVASSVNLEQFKKAVRHTGTDEIKNHEDKHGMKIDYQIDKRTRLDKISTKLAIAVTGPSGVGKSSLINALRGLDNNDKNAAEVSFSETSKE